MAKQKKYADSVFAFMRQRMEALHSSGRVRSGDMLKTTLNRFIDFRHNEDCTFGMFDASMMQLFQSYLRGRGLRRNTIGFYMRVMRTAFNAAVDRGLAPSCNPFRGVYTGKDSTVKRALGAADMRHLAGLCLDAFPALDYARDMFMFSFYARGMSFVDMAYLRKSDLCGTHFTYSRRKTGQSIVVEWLPEMQAIVDKYPANPTPYLLPIIVDGGKPHRRQYLNKIEQVNRALKQVAGMAAIDRSLTLYYARHTWSTMARDSSIPISVISKALGHDCERTTQIYLDSIHTTVVDNANRTVIDAIKGEGDVRILYGEIQKSCKFT